MRGQSYSDTVILPLKTSDGDYAFTDIEKGSTLNDYFCKISSVDDSNTELPFFENRTITEIADINILESEMADTLSSLKVNKACGPDDIIECSIIHVKPFQSPCVNYLICHFSVIFIQIYGNQLLLCKYLRKATNRKSVTIDQAALENHSNESCSNTCIITYDQNPESISINSDLCQVTRQSII